MKDNRIPAGQATIIRLHEATGDLTVNAWAEQDILVVAEDESDAAAKDHEIVLTCRGDAVITLPAGLQFQFDRVAGDARFTNTRAAIEGKRINGDLTLSQTGSTNIGAVGGDASATDCKGDLQLAAVGGDLSVHSLAGNLSARVAGDLKVSSATGMVAANAGGDAHLDLDADAGSVHAIQAGGNIACRLTGDANATLNLQYGGSLYTGEPSTRQPSDSRLSRLVIGSGDAVINLVAGGNITVTNVDGSTKTVPVISTDAGDDFARQVEQSVRTIAGNLEAQIGMLAGQLDAQGGDEGCGDEIAARIHERIQHAMAKAKDKMEKAARKAEAKAERKAAVRAKSRTVARKPAVSAEERAAVLRMLEEGKITLEQADGLLSALDV